MLAVMKAVYAIAYIEAWKSEDFSGVSACDLQYRCDALTNWAMKTLMLGAGDLWVLRSPWGVNVKLYMKYFIYWTADVKSSKLWSSQLWTQFMQLRILKPEKVRTLAGFKPVTSCYRCDTLTNWAMKYFICWTVDEKSSNLWSSQLWKQFMQLRIKKPEKVTTSTGFELVRCSNQLSNLCDCVYRSLKKSGLQQGLNPWPLDTGATL